MKLSTALIFGNNMVIQQGKHFVIWGEAEPGVEVTVSIQGKAEAAITDSEGKWKAVLPALEMAQKEQLFIQTPEEEILYENVAVGEVWLAGGQSNMEFYMRYDAEYSEEVKNAENPNIRFFDYPEVCYEGQLEEYNYDQFGFWRTCDSTNLEYYSAVAYYFAKEMQQDLHVPIGIIGCNLGGSPSCAWMSEKSIRKAGESWLTEYEEGVKTLDLTAYAQGYRCNPMNDRTNPFMEFNEIALRGVNREQQLAMMSQMPPMPETVLGPMDAWRPAGLYETMLKKLVPYGIRGFLFYQGESDDPKAELYQNMLTTLIEDWRGLWKEELPFLFVQLAPFEVWLAVEAMDYPTLREAQEQVAKNVPSAWMASTGDVGCRYDIHPKNKRPVGERLALLAKGHVYGEDISCDAPEAESAGRIGNIVEVLFKHAEALQCAEEKINAVQIYIGEQEIADTEYELQISGNKLIISWKSELPGQLRIAFARTNYYQVNLYNEANIPVKPFEIIV